MKIPFLMSVGLILTQFSQAQCIDPDNTDCDLREAIWATCDLCMTSVEDYTFYTQCQAASSFTPAATNSPTWAIPDDEVWFSFTAPRTTTGFSSANSKITITVIGNCEMNPVIELFDDLCPGISVASTATGVGLSNGSNIASLTIILDACTEYAFRVYHEGVGTAGDGDFQLLLTVDRPDNDQCHDAYALSVNNAWVDATNVSATESYFAGSCNSQGQGYINGASYDDDVWFSFNSSSTDVRIDIKGITQCNSKLSSTFDPVFELWAENPCDNPSATPVKCINENSGNTEESYDFHCLEANETYYIRVADFNDKSCISGAEFQIRAAAISCTAPANDDFCKAAMLHGSWPDYFNDGIEEGNAAGVAPNTHSAYRLYRPYFFPSIACATFETTNNEPEINISGTVGAGQTVWYRFLAPENCDADVLIHTNSASTDFNTAIAVYETVSGYTDDPESSFPPTSGPYTIVDCSSDLSNYINTTPIATSDDWPAGGPTVTSGYHLSDPHFSTLVSSGSTNSLVRLTTGSTGGYDQITPGKFYYVQVDGISSDEGCLAGNFDIYFQVVQNDVPVLANLTSSCGSNNYLAEIEWTCDNNAPEVFEILRTGPAAKDEPTLETALGNYAVTPHTIAGPSAPNTFSSDLDCLPCGGTYDAWVFYKNTTFNGNTLAGRATSHKTFALRFTTPSCPGSLQPEPSGVQVHKEPELSIYPNPNNTSILTLEYRFQKEVTGTLSVDITTLDGKFVKSYRVDVSSSKEGSTTISIEGISPGAYLVRLTNNRETLAERLSIND